MMGFKIGIGVGISYSTISKTIKKTSNVYSGILLAEDCRSIKSESNSDILLEGTKQKSRKSYFKF